MIGDGYAWLHVSNEEVVNRIKNYRVGIKERTKGLTEEMIAEFILFDWVVITSWIFLLVHSEKCFLHQKKIVSFCIEPIWFYMM